MFACALCGSRQPTTAFDLELHIAQTHLDFCAYECVECPQEPAALFHTEYALRQHCRLAHQQPNCYILFKATREFYEKRQRLHVILKASLRAERIADDPATQLMAPDSLPVVLDETLPSTDADFDAQRTGSSAEEDGGKKRSSEENEKENEPGKEGTDGNERQGTSSGTAAAAEVVENEALIVTPFRLPIESEWLTMAAAAAAVPPPAPRPLSTTGKKRRPEKESLPSDHAGSPERPLGGNDSIGASLVAAMDSDGDENETGEQPAAKEERAIGQQQRDATPQPVLLTSAASAACDGDAAESKTATAYPPKRRRRRLLLLTDEMRQKSDAIIVAQAIERTATAPSSSPPSEPPPLKKKRGNRDYRPRKQRRPDDSSSSETPQQNTNNSNSSSALVVDDDDDESEKINDEASDVGDDSSAKKRVEKKKKRCRTRKSVGSTGKGRKSWASLEKGARIACGDCGEMVIGVSCYLRHHVTLKHLRKPAFECSACHRHYYSINDSTTIKRHIASNHAGQKDARVIDHREAIRADADACIRRLFPQAVHRQD